jgi:hypothetical protein
MACVGGHLAAAGRQAGMLTALAVLVMVAVAVIVIATPLRAGAARATEDSLLRELELARVSMYREIRDLEMDYRTGKLSMADYHASDASLRAEALEILDRLQREFPAVETTAAPTGPEGDGPGSCGVNATPDASAGP